MQLYHWSSVELSLLLVIAVVTLQVVASRRRLSKERDLALVRLRESEEKLSALMCHGQSLVYLLRPNGTLLLANQRALAMAQVTPAETLDRPYSEGAFWRRSPALAERMSKAIDKAASGQGDEFHATYHDDAGEERFLDFSVTPCLDGAGRVQWLLIEGRDVTERVRVEQRCRQEQRLELIGKLAGGIAHDFNNMLAGILGAADLARSLSKDAEVDECLGIVIDASRRAASLTKQLLAFARRGKPHFELLHVHELMKTTVKLFHRVAGPSITVQIRHGAAFDSVLGDPAQLEGALMSLLVNAKDAMPQGGTIWLSTTTERLTAADAARLVEPVAEGQYLRLSVLDEGVGIAPDVAKRLFEPFFTTKEARGSTGLGLAAVLGTIAEHSGAIEVQSVAGDGATFVLYLPLAGVTETTIERPSIAKLRGNGSAILLVDDELFVRQALARLLQHRGFSVTAVEGAEAAFSYLATAPRPPAAALLDLHLRGMNGQQLAKALRLQLPELPIIMSSGNFSEWDLTELENDPSVRLVAKPARLEELMAAFSDFGLVSAVDSPNQ